MRSNIKIKTLRMPIRRYRIYRAIGEASGKLQYEVHIQNTILLTRAFYHEHCSLSPAH